MPFAPRNRDTIRTSLLANWSARYAARGKILEIAEGSDAYLFADALALEQENVEAGAASLTLDILPSTSSRDILLRFGAVYGLPMQVATPAAFWLDVRGPADATYAIVNQEFTDANGTTFRTSATSVTTTTDGYGTHRAGLLVTCLTPGVGGSHVAGDYLTWSAAPTGFDPSALVVGPTYPGTVAPVPGQDEETLAHYAARIEERMGSRPASGNREDWRAWCEAFSGVVEAYVYPLMAPPTGPYDVTTPRLGCVTALVLGPAQGDSPVQRQLLGLAAGAEHTALEDYIEGTRDAGGAAVASGTQLRPVTMARGDYSVHVPNLYDQDVVAELVLAPGYEWGWTGSAMTTDAASDATHLVVTGDQTAKNGAKALVFIGSGFVRGAYQLVTLPVGSYNGGTNKTTWTFGAGVLAHDPPGGYSVFPGLPDATWNALRLALFAFFDNLGPADTSTPTRWPSEDVRSRSRLYTSALTTALMAGYPETLRTAAMPAPPGVLSATITTPASPALLPPTRGVWRIVAFHVVKA